MDPKGKRGEKEVMACKAVFVTRMTQIMQFVQCTKLSSYTSTSQ